MSRSRREARKNAPRNRINVVVLGDPETGKTSLLKSFAKIAACEWGVDEDAPLIFTHKQGDQEIPFYFSENDNDIETVHAYLIVYDMTNRTTFSNIAKWKQDEIDNIDRGDQDSPLIIVVGTKGDIQEEYDMLAVKNAVYDKGMLHAECSTQTHEGVSEILGTLASKMLENTDEARQEKEKFYRLRDLLFQQLEQYKKTVAARKRPSQKKEPLEQRLAYSRINSMEQIRTASARIALQTDMTWRQKHAQLIATIKGHLQATEKDHLANGFFSFFNRCSITTSGLALAYSNTLKSIKGDSWLQSTEAARVKLKQYIDEDSDDEGCEMADSSLKAYYGRP